MPISIFSSQKKTPKVEAHRARITAFITLDAYDAITEIRRRHRRETGKHLRLWQVLDAAVRAYAQQQGIAVGE